MITKYEKLSVVVKELLYVLEDLSNVPGNRVDDLREDIQSIRRQIEEAIDNPQLLEQKYQAIKLLYTL